MDVKNVKGERGRKKGREGKGDSGREMERGNKGKGNGKKTEQGEI